MQYITAKIHNNSLGQVKMFDNWTDASSHIHKLFEEQIGHYMDDDESEQFDNDHEIYIEEDDDNTYTFSIGIVE